MEKNKRRSGSRLDYRANLPWNSSEVFINLNYMIENLSHCLPIHPFSDDDPLAFQK